MQWLGSGGSSYSGIRGDAVGRLRDGFGGRAEVRLPITDDDFTTYRFGRRASDVSSPIFVISFRRILYRQSVCCTPRWFRTDLPETPEFPSPVSPAAMDRILVEDVDLVMDSTSDLPSLLSLLLPAPSSRVLPPKPVVAPSAGASALVSGGPL